MRGIRFALGPAAVSPLAEITGDLGTRRPRSHSSANLERGSSKTEISGKPQRIFRELSRRRLSASNFAVQCRLARFAAPHGLACTQRDFR